MTWTAEPRSFLGWAQCSRPGCQGRALVAESHASTARCGPCLAKQFPAASRTPWTPVAGYPIGLGSTLGTPPADVSYPAPEVSSRDGLMIDWPEAFASLARFAQAHGWQVREQYARGRRPHGTTGRPGAVRDSLALRMMRGRRSAVAVYVHGTSSWQWETMYVWADGENHRRMDNVTALKAELSA